jgi:hypothetical protein
MSEKAERSIAEEVLVEPSKVTPTLFVGLGGAGCKVIKRVSEHLRRRPDYAERYEKLTKFAFMDTNINDLEKYRAFADEIVLISDFEKSAYADLASGKKYLEADPYFTQWAFPNYKFRAGDTAGAGQIRVESRLGVYYQLKHRDMLPRLRRLLELLKAHQHGHRRLDSGEIRIVICYSVAGGTGSGAHLPIAYVLRDLAKQLGTATLIGVALLPSIFEEKTRANSDGTFANGYAALKETEHLMKLGSPQSRYYPDDGRLEFHYNPSDTSRTHVNDKPFEFLYVIDRPESFSVENVEAAAGDGLYLQLFSSLFKEQAGDYDNYLQHQRVLVPSDFEDKGIPGYTSFYGSYGAAVLHVPTAGIVEYCTCAAALSILKQSFLGGIPADSVYEPARARKDDFFRIAEDDGKNAVLEAHFKEKEPAERAVLKDRLFAKRIRMLAACEEQKRQRGGTFWQVFRHGHRLGTVPNLDGIVPKDDGQNVTASEDTQKALRKELDALTTNGLEYSIGHLVIDAIDGLYGTAERAMDDRAITEVLLADVGVKETPIAKFQQRKQILKGELVAVGETQLRAGGGQGGMLGFDDLKGLKFLNAENTGAVNLRAKRYAAICIMEHIAKKLREGGSATQESYEPNQDTERGSKTGGVPTDQVPTEWKKYRGAASDDAKATVQKYFYDQLTVLNADLEKYLKSFRSMEDSYDEVARKQGRKLARLRKEGHDSTEKYVLDAEAFQIEGGRRMWDFYYEDRIADLDEVKLQGAVAELVSDKLLSLGNREAIAGTATDELFDSIQTQIGPALKDRIEGDIRHVGEAQRAGLRLDEALKLEVIYRALYLTSREEIDKDDRDEGEGRDAIRKLIVRNNVERKPLDMEAPVHKDYLRDKIRRVLKERADLLCYLDEKHLNLGGVRPDIVALAAINADLAKGFIGDAITNSQEAAPKMVTEDWPNLKEVVFYKAILNVPLFVFGRLEQMRGYYERFKKHKRQSKVLHIDRNWEDGLLDLDPDVADRQHRQRLQRAQIVDFAVLLAVDPAGGSDPNGVKASSAISMHEGCYCLRVPRAPGQDGDETPRGIDNEPLKLGELILGSVSSLPERLEGRSVDFDIHRRLLATVRKGLVPPILNKITKYPREWRNRAQKLRSRFGEHASLDQEARIEDFSEAANRLFEGLRDLLGALRELDATQAAAGPDPEATSVVVGSRRLDNLKKNVDQSIVILENFVKHWEQPTQMREFPEAFKDFFEPLSEETLRAELAAVGGQADKPAGASPSPGTPPAKPKTPSQGG